MDRAEEALRQVRVPSPERRIKDYPHQLSGGMRQRVMIAIALACGPDLLIADEPTTALDVTVQAEIIDLMAELCAAKGTAILMISHDLGLVANMCRRVAVMYAGRIVEKPGRPRRSSPRRAIPTRRAWSTRCRGWASAPRRGQPAAARDLGRRALDRGLSRRLPLQSALPGRRPTSAARPRPRSRPCRPTASCGATIMAEPLLKLDDLAVHFTVGGALRGGTKTLKAVDGVSLDVKPGECLGLVGESGCGKSTLALAIMGLVPPTRGRIVLDGQVVTGRQAGDRKALARTVQMVFQDPYASLNPRQTVRRTLADPLRLHGVTDKAEVDGPRRRHDGQGRPAARPGRPLPA